MKTAKEALLEEHSKDNRIRYITQHYNRYLITRFWSYRPVWDSGYEKWDEGIESSLIKTTLDPIEFNKEWSKEKILYIEDILVEELSQDTQLSKPPIGILPNKLRLENRVKEINEAIKRYIDSNVSIDPTWIQERNEILERLK